MSNLTNIIKKELKELLTKSTIVPVILMAFLFAGLGSMMGGVEEEASAPPVIGVVDLDDGVLSDLAAHIFDTTSEVVYNGTDPDDGLDAVREHDGVALIIIPSNFTSDILNGSKGIFEIVWIMKGAGILDGISSATVDSLVRAVGLQISAYLISLGGDQDPAAVLSPIGRLETTIFKDREMEGISPSTLSMMSIQSFTVPFVIMMIIIITGGMVISSMGMEKENKTLETLMTLPVSRGTIVSAKLIASALVGLVMVGIYMIGFNYYMGSMQASAEVDLSEYGLTLGAVDFVLIGVSIFVSLLAALAMCMVLGTYARNYKSAQTLTMPVTLLAAIPMFITMFKDFGTLPLPLQAMVFAIPFSHPMMAMRELMFDNYALVLSGIAYVAVFTGVMMTITVWIFSTDRLLTGSTKKGPLDKLLRRRTLYK